MNFKITIGDFFDSGFIEKNAKIVYKADESLQYILEITEGESFKIVEIVNDGLNAMAKFEVGKTFGSVTEMILGFTGRKSLGWKCDTLTEMTTGLKLKEIKKKIKDVLNNYVNGDINIESIKEEEIDGIKKSFLIERGKSIIKKNERKRKNNKTSSVKKVPDKVKPKAVENNKAVTGNSGAIVNSKNNNINNNDNSDEIETSNPNKRKAEKNEKIVVANKKRQSNECFLRIIQHDSVINRLLTSLLDCVALLPIYFKDVRKTTGKSVDIDKLIKLYGSKLPETNTAVELIKNFFLQQISVIKPTLKTKHIKEVGSKIIAKAKNCYKKIFFGGININTVVGEEILKGNVLAFNPLFADLFQMFCRFIEVLELNQQKDISFSKHLEDSKTMIKKFQNMLAEESKKRYEILDLVNKFSDEFKKNFIEEIVNLVTYKEKNIVNQLESLDNLICGKDNTETEILTKIDKVIEKLDSFQTFLNKRDKSTETKMESLDVNIEKIYEMVDRVNKITNIDGGNNNKMIEMENIIKKLREEIKVNIPAIKESLNEFTEAKNKFNNIVITEKTTTTTTIEDNGVNNVDKVFMDFNFNDD